MGFLTIPGTMDISRPTTPNDYTAAYDQAAQPPSRPWAGRSHRPRVRWRDLGMRELALGLGGPNVSLGDRSLLTRRTSPD